MLGLNCDDVGDDNCDRNEYPLLSVHFRYLCTHVSEIVSA